MWPYSTYSKINPVAKKNFPFKKPRPDQLETISQIIEAIDKGYKYIILEAGTGTGKSAIAYTLTSIYETSYILTVTKQLQNQYLEDFSNFKLVKGRKNFSCKQYLNQNCSEGKCIVEGISCKNKSEDKIICDYLRQKQTALDSNKVISNYHYMFLELNYVGDFTKRDLLILDEAHNLENTLMSQLKLEFSISDLQKYLNVDIDDMILYELENGDFDTWIQFINEIREKYSNELSKLTEIDKTKVNEKISFIKQEIYDCSRFVENISHDPYSWIFDYNEDLKTIEFKPLKIDNYAKNTLFKYGDVCILMSASILDYKFFSKCLGLKEDEVYPIRRKSPFDLKRNPIIAYDDFNLSHKNIKKTAPKTINPIKSILDKHKNEKGIIHTVSSSCKDYLMGNLEDYSLIDHDGENRQDRLWMFKNSDEPLVFISPSMGEGVNLPGDLCRFQIMYKLPYPDLADKQIRMRANADDEWYDYKTAMTLIQTYGRGMRYAEDYCTTYLIDNRIKEFVKRDSKTNKFLPDSFVRAVLDGET